MSTNKERLTANNALIDQAQELADALPDAIGVDDTLTVSGAAADAKVTGEKFTALESEVAKIPKYKIVSELPTEGISATTVYLVADKTEERDKYSEFIFVVSENAPDDGFGRYDETAGTWEIFGSGTVDVDLSEIEGRIDELSEAISNKVSTVNGVVPDENGNVELPESGGALDTTFLYDSGNIVLVANTISVDTGLVYTDLTEWGMFYVRVGVVEAPWTAIAPDLYFSNTSQKTAVNMGKYHKHIWYFNLIGDTTYMCVGVGATNGNLGEFPPRFNNPYDTGYGGKVGYATALMRPVYDVDLDDTLKVYIPANSENLNIRVTVGGIKRRNG